MDCGVRREPAFEPESEAYELFTRGMALLRTRHAAQAAMLLRRALTLEPGRNSIREGLGRAEYALGRHEQAAELFETILTDCPDNDYARYALGRCLGALGRDAEALAQLRLARALAPHNDVYREALADADG
jgi:Flp pilus assembly protein TadD